MDKAIKIHCMHCAVWQVVPIKSKPFNVVSAFRSLQKETDETERYFLLDFIARNTDGVFATFRWMFDGGGYYINGVPQSDEIHTDADGNRHRIIGYFQENYCEG